MMLALVPGRFALTRLDRDTQPPPLPDGPLAALVRDGSALTVVGPDAAGDWRALQVAGPLDLALTGVMASIAKPLADAEIPLFVVSSYHTDFVLVPVGEVTAAVAALRAAGHEIREGV
jgi:uncharacterized protein